MQKTKKGQIDSISLFSAVVCHAFFQAIPNILGIMHQQRLGQNAFIKIFIIILVHSGSFN